MKVHTQPKQAKGRYGCSAHLLLVGVPLPLLSQPHSTALPSPKRYDKRYEDHYLSGRNAELLKIISYEAKPCMLAFLKSGVDFSKGYAGQRICHLLFATHPYHPDSHYAG